MSALVDYASSGDEDGRIEEQAEEDFDTRAFGTDGTSSQRRSVRKAGPASGVAGSSVATKRRKLTGFAPGPAASSQHTPVSEPGRPRGSKVGDATAVKPSLIEGNWLCYAFVRVPLSHELQDHLKLVTAALADSADANADLKISIKDDVKVSDDPGPIVTSTAQAKLRGHLPSELNISLTRPILVRPHEREEFRRLVVDSLSGRSSFKVHFARLITLINDDRSRLFFALEVGTGWQELHDLTGIVNEPLKAAFRAQAYYSEARYHASFASVSLSGSAKQGAEHWESLANRLQQEHGRAISRCSSFAAESVGIRIGDLLSHVPLSAPASKT